MTGPAMTPPPPTPTIASAPQAVAITPESATATRPGGVTFACVLSIVLGAFGVVAGLVVMLVASLIGSIVGAVMGSSAPTTLGAGIGLMIGLFPMAMGVLGIVAGTQGLKGASWARWTMVVLFALGALFTVGGFAAVLPLAITALDVVAIVMLTNAQATSWFNALAR